MEQTVICLLYTSYVFDNYGNDFQYHVVQGSGEDEVTFSPWDTLSAGEYQICLLYTSYIGMTTRGTAFTDTKASKTQWNFYWLFPYHKNAEGKMIVGGTPKYVCLLYTSGITYRCLI